MANTMSKYGSNTNRPLSEIVGLSTDTKPTDSIEGIKIQNGSSFRELDTGKRFLFDAENITWNEVSSGGGGGSTLIEKSISANGVYNASDDSADGYSKVTVDVPNTYTAEDEGKVVDNGALVAQTAMSSEVTENGTVDTTLYNSVTVNVSSGGVEFNNSPTTFSLVKNIKSLDAIIPDGITSIGTNAFYECAGLESIVIPNGVTTIGNGCFYKCTNLTEIDIPDSVTTIGDTAFSFSGLVNLTISNSVTSIGGACMQMPELESIKILANITTIPSMMCYACSKLNNIEFSNSITTIGSEAFRDCTSLTNVTLPSSLTTINSQAFGGTALTSIAIPSSVTTIHTYAFRNCNALATITIDKAEGSITGAPWGATNATVVWTG